MPIGKRLKRSFVAGLFLVAPLVVTILVLRVATGWLLGFIDPIVQNSGLLAYAGNDELAAQAIAIVLIVGTITVLGYLAQLSVGRHLFGNIGRVVNVIPMVSTIYGGVRTVADSLVDRQTSFQSVVFVETPRDGLYSIGLVTGDAPEQAEAIADEPVYNVYMPHSPNPTQGRLQLVPESRLHETDLSVRRGMRLLLTTGIGEEGEPSELPDLPPEERSERSGDDGTPAPG